MTESELQDNLFATDGYQAVVVDNRPVSLTVYAEAVAKGRSASASFPDSLPSVLVFEARTDDDIASFAGHVARIVGKRLRPATGAIASGSC